MEQENLNKGTPAPDSKTGGGKEPKKSPPKKELSLAERQKRKKMLIMPLFFLIFGGAMWLIFSPSDKDETKVEGLSGLNAELPVPKDEGIVGDKRDAYEQEAMRQKEQERMRSLQDFSSMFDQAEEPKQAEPNQPEYYENPSARQTKPVNNLQASANAYQDINKQLGEWYEEPAGKSAQELAVEERMNELERKLEEAEARKAAEDEQTALLEKSYAMAARYMPPQAGQDENNNAVPSTKDKVNVQPVKQVRHNVVSLLSAPMSDDEFIESFSQPRNMGFLTAAGNEGVKDKNSIHACVYQTVTLTSGKELQIRLLEPMQAGNILIPANSVVTGACRIGGERIEVTINSIQYAGNIIPVELQVYDLDGQRGISVPNSDEIRAAKEIASQMAQSAGSSITITDDAGSQFAADIGKSLIQGASQYVSKKMSVVKVTLKANHRLLLLPKEN
ncbi:conjugative transposon TraM protein [Dysgonomonas sp. PFB1-18]|uniref:conjugative transposon protein TraM n=1 Tax=unclassified Dysgonomonas TaxID=2630389 RepID=UPI0024769AD1|nr:MULTISPECIES: conjugative transposon protein TraM [unclassified Dysgonomonas]MDH6310188.1 conjugative transposon TraM protein [Dysgonomonas sp. PF1-14]MDH6340146.1 conjugative transposon TraM protein [Dysgonomonas sp. PF1-16]MDH6381745.1 conjugative transposon TraM protein [Dysgonomonas sp. PFB1-18]MDH6399104.1 conjugative transposon TraM protein [Dysgonomonas sp. PF1-23]